MLQNRPWLRPGPNKPRCGQGEASRWAGRSIATGAIDQLKALIVGAPEELRAELRRYGTSSQVEYCAVLRDRPTWSLEHRMTVRALRCTAQRIQLLTAEASQLEGEIDRLVGAVAP
jgi:transposase